MDIRFPKFIALLIVVCFPLLGMAQEAIRRLPKQKTTSHINVVNPPDGYISDHGYVDMGLPSGIKWAVCNVGASSPSDYGDYFAWGETSSKITYDKENSKTYNKAMEDISGNTSYDAARANWGNSWCLPTKADFVELLNECSWTWIQSDGHNGYLVKGPNGKSIFLPAAGHRNGATYEDGTYGNYWSSTPHKTREGRHWHAYLLDFSRNGRHHVARDGRIFGFPVRPVSH